jgi:Fur family peroxide stress response transcriptional regulator
MLQAKGIKPTFQRVRILDALLRQRSHPTIKTLHDRLLRTVPTLSKTTLYTTLELFAARGLAARLTIDSGEIRYDGVAAPHHHFLCGRCGAILDLDIACPTGRRGAIQGHAIHEVHGYFKGVCKDCLIQYPKE